MYVTGRYVGVLERGAGLQVVERRGEFIVDVLLWVVCPDPPTVLHLNLVRVLLAFLDVDAVLVVQEAELLTAGDAFEAAGTDRLLAIIPCSWNERQ